MSAQKSTLSRIQASHIVKVNCDTINCYRQLAPLPPLVALFLAKNLPGKVASRTIGTVQRARKCLEHIWRVYLKFGRHLRSAVAAN